jgi:type IV pilus assembly protein PilC
MESFKYEIVGADGKIKSGTLEAANMDAATVQLKSGGNLIVTLAKANVLNRDISISIGRAVKPRELSVFCRQFESVLNSGVTVIGALEMLEEQTDNTAFRKAIEAVSSSVQRGETLAEAMMEHPKVFPEIMVYMIQAGEASGSLDIAFKRLAEHFEKDAHLRGLVAKALVYPAVLLCVIIAIVAIMMIKIVPTVTASYTELGAGELPAITRMVMGVSDFMVDNWYVMLAVVLGITLICKAFTKTERGAVFFGRLSLKMPLFGNLTIKAAAARLTRTLSTLMASGIQMVDAVHIVRQIMGNEIVKQVMGKAEEEVTHGVPLSTPLRESGVFPPMVYHMIEIGEQTGNMEGMLDRIADYYDEEVEMETQSLMAALEPLLIIMMALVVVPVILAVMMPMYSLYDSIG